MSLPAGFVLNTSTTIRRTADGSLIEKRIGRAKPYRALRYVGGGHHDDCGWHEQIEQAVLALDAPAHAPDDTQ